MSENDQQRRIERERERRLQNNRLQRKNEELEREEGYTPKKRRYKRSRPVHEPEESLFTAEPEEAPSHLPKEDGIQSYQNEPQESLVLRKSFHYDGLFVGICLFFGVLFCMITPPMQAPDEVTHFLKSYSLSQMQLIPEVVDGEIVNDFDAEIVDFAYAFTDLQGDPNSKLDISDIMNWVQTSVGTSNNVVSTSYVTVGSYIVYYIPQAVGMFMANALGLSAYWILCFGRLSNLFFYTILMYTAIRITPVGKNLFFLVALMPMSLFLAASVSYDAMVMGIAAIFTALLLRLIFDERYELSSGAFAQIIILASMLVFLKTVYYPLILLIFAVPSHKFGGKRERFKTFISIVVTNFVVYIIIMLFRRMVYSGVVAGESMAGDQLAFLISNPTMIWDIFTNTITVFGEAFQEGFIGNLGWLDTPLPIWVISLYYFCFILALLAVEEDEARLLKSGRGANLVLGIDTAIIVTAFLVLLFITFYATVTVQAMASVGTDVVLGIQGRYFIPISFIVFVTIKAIVNAKFNIGRIYNRMDRYISVSYVIIAIVVSLFVVIQRYYI